MVVYDRMEPKIGRCIIDKNNIAKICVDETSFNFSYTDDVKEKMKSVLTERERTVPEQERARIQSAIASLDDPLRNKNVIPHEKIKMAGILPKSDEKDGMLLAILVDPEFSRTIHMKNSYALIPIGKNDAVVLNDAIPKNINRAKDIDELIDSLS